MLDRHRPPGRSPAVPQRVLDTGLPPQVRASLPACRGLTSRPICRVRTQSIESPCLGSFPRPDVPAANENRRRQTVIRESPRPVGFAPPGRGLQDHHFRCRPSDGLRSFRQIARMPVGRFNVRCHPASTWCRGNIGPTRWRLRIESRISRGRTIRRFDPIRRKEIFGVSSVACRVRNGISPAATPRVAEGFRRTTKARFLLPRVPSLAPPSPGAERQPFLKKPSAHPVEVLCHGPARTARPSTRSHRTCREPRSRCSRACSSG